MIFVIAVFAVSSLASATLAYMYFWQDRHLAGLIWACVAMVYGHFAIEIAEDWFTKD